MGSKRLSMAELERLSRRELQDLKLTVEDDLGRVKNQIAKAKAEAHSGEYSDPKWWASVNAASRAIGGYHQRIATALSRLRESENESRREEFEELRASASSNRRQLELAFVNLAREALEPELFEDLLTNAKRLRDEG